MKLLKLSRVPNRIGIYGIYGIYDSLFREWLIELKQTYCLIREKEFEIITDTL